MTLLKNLLIIKVNPLVEVGVNHMDLIKTSKKMLFQKLLKVKIIITVKKNYKQKIAKDIKNVVSSRKEPIDLTPKNVKSKIEIKKVMVINFVGSI